MARSDDPTWDLTTKHNIRIPDPMWDAAVLKAARLSAEGYRMVDTLAGDKPVAIDTTKVIRNALSTFNDEDDDETVSRLGLTRAAADAR